MSDLKLEKFIKRAIKIHGEIYDYSKSVYTGYKDNILIICKDHGEFWQSPNNHLSGKKCKKCSGFKVSNLEDFIKESNFIHKNFYNYSESIYIASRIKTNIICPKHGIFKQSPNDHLNGYGCPECGLEKSKNSCRFTTEDFINKAKLIHGNKYDYSKVNYINQSIKVILICPEHSEFKIQPNNHLSGKGCSICGANKRGLAKRLDKSEFITRSKIIHEITRQETHDFSRGRNAASL